MTMKSFIGLLCLASVALGQTSRDLLQGSLPALETYWESFTAFPTRPESCLDLSSYEDSNPSDYGINLQDIPDEVKIVNIAFADALNNCDPRTTIGVCEPYVCGLHLYGINGINEDDFLQLKDDIAQLQARGKLVKLAYGGQEYGNVDSKGDSRQLINLVSAMVRAVDLLGLDGIDLANEEGGGYDLWLHGAAQTGHHLYLIRK
jgi:chitinase